MHKSLQRNTMSDERLSSLAVLQIHEHKDVNVDNVIIKFAQKRKGGGTSPGVCKQCQLTNESCKLPKYELKEAKTVVLYKV